MRCAWIIVVATGCRGLLGIDDPQLVSDDVPPGDTGAVCYGADLVRVCLAAPPTGAIVFDQDTFIDTDLDPICVAGVLPVCAVAGGAVAIAVNGRVIAQGVRPLVLLATDGAITIDGAIDVASHLDLRGAGANPVSCAAGTPAAANGGGFGGSFGGPGGNGGAGSNGAGGVAAPAIVADAFTGGCAGGVAGGGTLGGPGGGGVWLFATTEIRVTDQINASGARGLGAGPGNGGGGGGAGGMIGLEAPVVSIAAGASVFANGAGGGEGGGGAQAGAGGAEPQSALIVAAGGAGMTTAGGDGGNGAAGASGALSGDVGVNQGGGGGGGGGAGIVRVISTAFDAIGVISPAPNQ